MLESQVTIEGGYSGAQASPTNKLGLEIGKSYNITYLYDGVEHTANKIAIDGSTGANVAEVEGAVQLGNMGTDAISLSSEEILVIVDGAQVDVSSGSWSQFDGAVVVSALFGEGIAKGVTIISIAEVENYLAQEVTFDSVSTLEVESTTPLQLVDSVGTYKIAGYYGESDTPFEANSVLVGDAGSGLCVYFETLNGEIKVYPSNDTGKIPIFCMPNGDYFPVTITGLYKIA